MRSTMAALGAVLTIGGCALWGGGEPEEGDDPAGEQMGQLIDTWSEADAEADGLRALADTVEPGGRLLIGDAARDDFVADLPRDVDGTVVASTGLDDTVLVVGVYHRCMEEGTVRVQPDTSHIWFAAFAPPEDRDTVCAWAPLTIEVWSVPHSDLGGTQPTDLVPGPPAQP